MLGTSGDTNILCSDIVVSNIATLSAVTFPVKERCSANCRLHVEFQILVLKRILLFCAWFEVLTAMYLKNAVFLNMAPCGVFLRGRWALAWRFIEFLLDYIKAVYHRDRLSISRHRLLNLPDTRCTPRWRSIGPALIGQAGEIDWFAIGFETLRSRCT